MFDSLRFIPVKSNIFSTISFALIILVIIFSDNIISNVSFDSDDQLQNHKNSQLLREKSTDADDHGYLVPPFDFTEERRVHPYQNKIKTVDPRFLKTSHLEGRFDSEITEFFSRNQCQVQLFMTWISPAESFGEREFFGLESLFQTNPTSCLIILSSSMDSREGNKILKPLMDAGFRVRAISPDLCSLFNNTPAENWLNEIRNGSKNPGEIPLPQNLSNLIRLAALYKYGGVYLDTDFIILKDLSGLRNSIGAQSIDVNGNWTRLNNAVLVFDRNHRLIHEFMEEFASTFDGNRWGHNGPYLVSRVVDRVAKTRELNITILSPMAFYPVGWTRISRLFARPNDQAGERWVEAKIRQLSRLTYGLHLWNRQSSRFKIEEGSVIWRLTYDHCAVCNWRFSSS